MLATAAGIDGQPTAMVANVKSTFPFDQGLAVLPIAFVTVEEVCRTELHFATGSRYRVCLSSRVPFVIGTFPYFTF